MELVAGLRRSGYNTVAINEQLGETQIERDQVIVPSAYKRDTDLDPYSMILLVQALERRIEAQN